VARAAGTALHLLLERWDRRDVAWLFEMAPRAARVAAAGEEADPERVLEALRLLLDRARRRGEIDKLARLRVLARELPVLYRDGDGRLWEGVIDLVAGEARAPLVVDFKTGPGSAGELERRHQEQLGRYAEGLERALGLGARPEAKVIALGGE
jgi:ATP-dependent exoDNAse (exonuclease V) beta subunit